MHTAEAARGRGVGRAMLAHLLAVARAGGFRRVNLETGTTAAFAPARTLYRSAGFVPCGPFGGYQPSADNTFMTLALGADAGQALPRSRPRSRAGLEWVRAPTATKWTPVSATARAVSSRSPPLASSRARG